MLVAGDALGDGDGATAGQLPDIDSHPAARARGIGQELAVGRDRGMDLHPGLGGDPAGAADADLGRASRTQTAAPATRPTDEGGDGRTAGGRALGRLRVLTGGGRNRNLGERRLGEGFGRGGSGSATGTAARCDALHRALRPIGRPRPPACGFAIRLFDRLLSDPLGERHHLTIGRRLQLLL